MQINNMNSYNENDIENISEIEMSSLNLENLDDIDLESMKGDTIGNTVYSAKWIINTLISLSKVYENGFNENLEESLCMLWDMTAEKDVVDFLMENDFLRIAEFTLEVPDEPRLTEIILGIIGNMCCQPSVLKVLSETNKLVSLIFGQLTTDDAETLIQVLRLLRSAVWDIQKNNDTKWIQHLKDSNYCGDAVSFILQSSTKDDLLIAAIDLVQSISIVSTTDENCLLTELFKVDQLVPALFESLMQLVPKRDINHSRTNLKAIENWLTIFSNIMQSEFRLFVINDTSGENYEKIAEILSRIFQPYKHASNLMPLDERVAICIRECVEMILWFQRNKINTDPKIVQEIVTIMHRLRWAIKESTPNQFVAQDETITELQKYLEKYWLETIDSYSESEILEIIRMCDNDLTKCLMEVATEYSKESQVAVDKLLRVEKLAGQF